MNKKFSMLYLVTAISIFNNYNSNYNWKKKNGATNFKPFNPLKGSNTKKNPSIDQKIVLLSPKELAKRKESSKEYNSAKQYKTT